MPISYSYIAITYLNLVFSGWFAGLVVVLSILTLFVPDEYLWMTRCLQGLLYVMLTGYLVGQLVMNITSSYPTGRKPLFLQLCPYTVVVACAIQGWFALGLLVALMAFPRFIALAALIEHRNSSRKDLDEDN